MSKIKYIFPLLLALITGACSYFTKPAGEADNWSSYLHDDRNTGVSSDSLPFPLFNTWTRVFQNPPQPAWPPPAKQDYFNGKRKLEPLVVYDRVFQPVVADNNVFISSSADNTISCYSAVTGKMKWKFSNDAPNRVAPLWYKGNLYVGSDDGNVYCINAKNGKLNWKRSFGGNRKMIGNGRIISSVPIRTGIVARGDTIYVAAGLLPEEHVSIHACNALTGEDYWEKTLTNLAPQGYPVLIDSLWYIPNSRVQPMAFLVKNGKLSHTLKGPGGDNLSFIDGRMVYGVDWKGEFNAKRLLESMVTGYKVTGMNNRMYIADDFSITAVDVKRFSETFNREQKLEKEIGLIVKEVNNNKPGNIDRLDSLRKELEALKQKKYMWQTATDKIFSLINTANAIITGQPDAVAAYNPETGKELWHTGVQGRPYGMAVYGNKLFVSTDKGYLYCFSKDNKNIEFIEEIENSREDIFKKFRTDELLFKLKKHFIHPNGYALIDGNVDLHRIGVLTQITGYQIVATSNSKRNITKSREIFDMAGLNGVKTTLFKGNLDELNFSDYMFNVIIVGKEYKDHEIDNIKSELFRILTPSGGRILISRQRNKKLYEALRKTYPDELKVIENKNFYVLERTKLPGSGEWTCLYANPANTASTGDKYASDRFRTLWFGQPGPREMSDRHHRAPSPLYKNGILYITLDMGVLAADAYNGTLLWKKTIPHFRRIKISRDAGNMTVDDRAFYAVADNFCYVNNPVTGEEEKVFRVPQTGWGAQDAHWGYVAVDGNSLIGSGRKPDAIFNRYSRLDWSERSRLVTSDYLFSVNKLTGKKNWIYKGGVILNPSICIGEGKIFFVESYNPEAVKDEDGLIAFNVLKKDMKVAAVDVNTGKVLWRKPYDFSMIEHILYGTYSDGILIMSGSGNVKGALWYGNYAFNASDGTPRWKQEKLYLKWTNGSHGEQIHRTVIMGGVVYTEPFAFDLKTGVEHKGWILNRGGHACGTLSGSADALFFRATNPAVCLPSKSDKGEKLNNITRPGCWINMIPAGGLLMIPEASSGCTCNFPLQMTIVYEPY